MTAFYKNTTLLVAVVLFFAGSLFAVDAKPGPEKDAPSNSDQKQTPPASDKPEPVKKAEPSKPSDETSPEKQPVKEPVKEPAEPEKLTEIISDLFVSGTDEYHTFRVPAITVTKMGALLAFCEGRKKGMSDSGDIDIVMKRSSDGGKTWSKLQVVFDDTENTVSNPCVVVDQYTGTIWLLCSWNNALDTEAEITRSIGKDTRKVFVLSSNDEGATWSKPLEITESVKRPEWTWYTTGPGTGIQLRLGKNKGRMIIPCYHKVMIRELEYHSHVIYSDDHGKTWQIGGIVANGTTECHVIERTDASLLMNMRRSRTKHGTFRMAAVSTDGGLSWSDHSFAKDLICPRSQSSFIRYTPSNVVDKKIVLHCNPASEKSRDDMTIKASFDDGETWPCSKLLQSGPSAYSSMAVAEDGTIVVLFETGEYHPYEKILFRAFSLDWLTDGKESNIPPVSIATRYRLAGSGLIDKSVDAVAVDAKPETEKFEGSPAGYEPNSPDSSAVITTNPFAVDGEILCVNARINEGGSLRVVIADEEGNTLASSRPMTESDKQCRITWAEGWQFASIKGKKIRLKFVFEKAILYEFYIK